MVFNNGTEYQLQNHHTWIDVPEHKLTVEVTVEDPNVDFGETFATQEDITLDSDGWYTATFVGSYVTREMVEIAISVIN